jgi:hypothetical protein
VRGQIVLSPRFTPHGIRNRSAMAVVFTWGGQVATQRAGGEGHCSSPIFAAITISVNLIDNRGLSKGRRTLPT